MRIYPQAGHSLPPPTVAIDAKNLLVLGGTQEGNAAARKAAWQELLCFLHRTLQGRRPQEETGAADPAHERS